MSVWLYNDKFPSKACLFILDEIVYIGSSTAKLK